MQSISKILTFNQCQLSINWHSIPSCAHIPFQITFLWVNAQEVAKYIKSKLPKIAIFKGNLNLPVSLQDLNLISCLGTKMTIVSIICLSAQLAHGWSKTFSNYTYLDPLIIKMWSKFRGHWNTYHNPLGWYLDLEKTKNKQIEFLMIHYSNMAQ